jgi:hypothetical protein
MRRLAFAAAALLLAATLGCGDRKNRETAGVSDTMPAAVTTPEAPDVAPGPRDFTFEERQDFEESIRQQLTGIDQEIEELASQAKSQGGAVSDRALARIRSTRQAVDRDLRRLGAATAANWDEVKTSLTRSVGKLEESIEVAQPK